MLDASLLVSLAEHVSWVKLDRLCGTAIKPVAGELVANVDMFACPLLRLCPC